MLTSLKCPSNELNGLNSYQILCTLYNNFNSTLKRPEQFIKLKSVPVTFSDIREVSTD